MKLPPPNFRLSVFEFLLIQLIMYSVIWLMNEYIGSLLSIILTPIFASLFVIALIAEALDRSNIPRIYFYYFITIVLAPALVGIFFSIIYQGNFDWMQN